MKFQAGQWLDVHIPGLPAAGGFTITSIPDSAKPIKTQDPYLELAVQYSPSNPPAAWLWKPEQEILGSKLHVRVGGSFTWPPRGVKELNKIKKIIFIAGGVGIK